MSITNYTEMVAAVTSWLNRDGFTQLEAEIPDFIAFGQRRIMYEIDLKAMEEVDATFTVDSQTETVPSDLLRVRSMNIVDSLGTTEILGAAMTDVLSYVTQDRPIKFDTAGSNFYFGPPPDQSYTVVLQYYKALPILTAAAPSNWFTDSYPEILLAATLFEALLWLKDDARAAVWEKQYNRYKAAIIDSEARQARPYGGMAARLR